MNSLVQDLRYAVRQLRKSPGFTAVAVLTLALGIGANTGIFTLVNAVLLKSLPVPNPEQLYLVEDNPPHGARFSYPMFQEARAAMPHGAELAGISWPARFYASFGGQPEMVVAQLVSGNYFPTLETHAELGRLLSEEDDRVVGGSPVAVISYGCWEGRFGRDPNVLGRKLVVNGMPLQVVGVAAQNFFGTHVGAAPEFWVPTAMQASVRYAQHYSEGEAAKLDEPWLPQQDIRWLRFIVRARNHQVVAPALAALNQVFRVNLEQAVAQTKDPQERTALLREKLQFVPGGHGLSTSYLEDFSQPLLALMAMVGIILLIACANLANLLLARAAAREREIAVRLSIGASRMRLVRQLLVECVLLSVVGTVLGSAVAYWLCSILPTWASSGSSPIPLSLAPDVRVLMFSASVAVLTGIAFGLAPAVQGTRVEPMLALKAGGRSAPAGGGSRWSFRQTLVALQVALSLVLLVGAGLFVRTLQNFASLDPGFDRDHLVSVWIDTHLGGYPQAQLPALYRRLIEQVEALPGVRSAALVTCEIASGCGDASDIYLPGVPHSNGETDAQERRVSQEFFATTGIPLIEGRSFADSDTAGSPPVVVANQAFVREFLHGKDPIGQYFSYDTANPYRFQIVGVVKDSRVNDIHEAAPPMLYHSLAQDVIDAESLLVRTSGDPSESIAQVRETVRSVDPNLPIGSAGTVTEMVSNSLAQQKLIARLTAMFGGLALALACLGLYGVMSYNVAHRTGELGVRFALGASRLGVLWLVIRQSIVLAGAGIAAGLLLSVLTAHTVSSLLFGLSPYDPATMLAAATVLMAVSLVSVLRPAWRAARVDPVVALRYE